MLKWLLVVGLVTILICAVLMVDNLVEEGVSVEVIFSKLLGYSIVICAAGMRVP